MDEDEIVDLSNAIDDPYSMQCCPFCDMAIMDYEPAVMFIAHKSKQLAHIQCAVEARDKLGV